MALEDKKSNRQGRNAVPPQYRRKRRWLKVLGIISVAVAIGAGVVFLAIPSLTALLEKPQENPNTVASAPAKPQPDQVIHLVAGGDVNVTDNTIMSGRTENGYDYSQCFRDILPILSQGDLMGCVMLLLGENDAPLQESDQGLAKLAAGFLGRQMES